MSYEPVKKSGAYAALFSQKTSSGSKNRPEKVYNILETDSAQMAALKESAQRRNLAVRTPPAAETVALTVNLVADRICKKQSVLVVSESRSILSLVENGLAPACGKVVSTHNLDMADFYQKARLRNNDAVEFKRSFNEITYAQNSVEIDNALGQLRSLDNAFHKRKQFGLSMIEMYSLCPSVGLDALDKNINAALEKSRLAKMNYKTMFDALNSIKEGDKAAKYTERATKESNNPLINFIKSDLESSELDKIRVYIKKFLSQENLPFNFAGYAYSRFALAFSLENQDRAGIIPLANCIMRLENPKLYKQFLFSLIPPLTPLAGYFGYKLLQSRKKIIKKLDTVLSAFKNYCSRFDFLKSVLEPRGLALVVDSMAYGNSTFLKKLASALDEYANVRDLNLCVRSLTGDERAILEFAASNARAERMSELLDKLLEYRVYNEVLAEEKRNEKIFGESANYAAIRNSVLSLAKAQCALNTELLRDSFDDGYVPFFQKNREESDEFIAEINKKENFMTMRQLIEKFGAYILRLFPCFILTPDEVKVFLPEKSELFDSVIFVNANRLSREAGTSGGIRAKSVVVLGDERQNGVRHGASGKSPESLWDIASKRFKTIGLRFCREARHEELLKFSNNVFYNNELKLLPPIARSKPNDALEFVKTEGSYTAKTNQIEAKAVVEQLKKIFRTREEGQSVGIVALSDEQAQLIAQLAEAECKRSDSFKKEFKAEIDKGEQNGGLYFKAAHELDGDRRDYIIMSVGFSTDAFNEADKSLPPDFENMLNTAITRANRRLIVVASADPNDFVNAKNKSEPFKLLGRFLQYTSAAGLARDSEIKKILKTVSVSREKEEDKPVLHKWTMALKSELEQSGFTVDIPADAAPKLSLAVFDKDSEQYVLGLVWDFDSREQGAGFYEREICNGEFLKEGGWNVLRIWSRDYWQNKATFVKAIEKELQAFKKQITISVQKEHVGVPTVKIRQKKKTGGATELIDEAYLTKVVEEMEKKENTKG